MNGETLKSVDKFTYLGSTLARNVYINDEVAHRTAKASAALGNMSLVDRIHSGSTNNHDTTLRCFCWIGIKRAMVF